MTADLIEWLRAQLKADEAAALAIDEDRRVWAHEETEKYVYPVGQANAYVAVGPWNGSMRKEEARHVAAHDPARVLREVAAKRRILGWAASPALPEIERLYVLDALAAVYADRPGYQEEWAP